MTKEDWIFSTFVAHMQSSFFLTALLHYYFYIAPVRGVK